jgi:hypothetical protein
MSDDSQDMAESLDEDVVGDVDDMSGDEYGDGLRDYPLDRPLGVDAFGVTASEEDAGESFAERTAHGMPEFPDDGTIFEHAGQLVEPNASTLDDEEELIADELGGDTATAEEAAVHIEREP